ncbi:MAG: ScpA family protein [Archaeoglobaceae archaeon]
MAKKGEIDPWNIDVIDVTDKFLRKIEEARKLDLRISARVLLYAAILVRMKSDVIAPQPLMNDEDVDVEIIEDLEELDEIDELSIEKLLIAQRRRVKKICTLKDLIEELKRAEAIEKRKKRRRKVDLNFVISIPHDESLEEKILEVENFLMKLLQRNRSVTLFSIANTREKILDYYISLLHLVKRGKFQISQKEFYGDIEIRLCEK